MKNFKKFIQQLVESKRKAAAKAEENAEADANEEVENDAEEKGMVNATRGKSKRRPRYIKFNNGEDDGQSLSPHQY